MNNNFENEYVSTIYNQIAEHFSSTRYSHWNLVKKYLENIQNSNSDIDIENKVNEDNNFLDFGCGNGKYLSLVKKFNNIYAIDNCEKLLDIVKVSYPNVKTIKLDVCDNIEDFGLLPNSFDTIISIAVIHHLSSEDRRIKMLKNIFMLLKSGGTCLISAWTNLIENKSKFIKLSNPGDYLIPWNNQYQRYYHLFEPDEIDNLIIKTNMFDEIIILSKKIELDNIFYEIKKL